MVNQLQDPMQRNVLRALGQCRGSQGISVDALNGKGWRVAAEALVEAGLAEEIKSIALEKTFRISRSGRYMLNKELQGALKR